MAEVRFDEEESIVSETSRFDREKKGLIKLVMHFGVKNEKQANLLLAGVMIVCLIATFYILFTYVF